MLKEDSIGLVRFSCIMQWQCKVLQLQPLSCHLGRW